MFTEDKRDLYEKYMIKEEPVNASKAQELEEFYGSESTKRANSSEYDWMFNFTRAKVSVCDSM